MFARRMSSQIIRPTIPFCDSIPGALHDGKFIEIKGNVPYGAESFEINLLTGLDTMSDRPLHISVRFNSHVVVRNSMQCNQWGPEERHGPFPFASGRDFSMIILVQQSSYRIAVNNQHCWEFAHRMPFSRVRTLYISGSVQIERIEYVDKASPYQPGTCLPSIPTGYPGDMFIPGQDIGTCLPLPGRFPGQGLDPSIVPAIPSFPSYITPPDIRPSSNLEPVYNPSIPYAYPIYGGLRSGMMIYISARPSASAYKFTINLQCGTAPYPPPDIGFHFDARFFNNTVVRNTRQNNTWETEETRSPFFPFQRAVNFDMIIRVDSDRYMIALNGSHFVEFNHRMWPLSRLDTLYIENDIVVSSIRFA